MLLSSLEKERELLRIFLRASQLENPALRRMDLHAFLMVRANSSSMLLSSLLSLFNVAMLFSLTGSSAANNEISSVTGPAVAGHGAARRRDA